MRVLVVDDHQLLREAITRVLSQADGFQNMAAFEASTPEEALLILQSPPSFDLLVTDLSFAQGVMRFDWIDQVRQKHPETPVIVVSGCDSDDVVDQCRYLGVSGFLSKTMRAEQIKAVATLIVGGDIYFPARKTPLKTIADLTDRQIDVLRGIYEGRSGKEIAKSLNIAESTVKTHTKAIYEALSVSGRVEALHVVLNHHELKRRIDSSVSFIG